MKCAATGLVIGLVATGTFIGACIGTTADGDPVYHQDFECYAYQLCRTQPPCLAALQECDSCSAPAAHEQCTEQDDLICVQPRFGVEEGGCGFIREGTCDQSSQCIVVITQDECHRDDCWTVTP